MIRKILTGGFTAALAAVMITLVANSAGTATAAVNGISASATTVDADTPAAATITIDANTADVVQVVATAGRLQINEATGCTGGPCVIGPGANDSQNATLTGNNDTIILTWDSPTTGPASATITAITGTTARSVAITVRGTANEVRLSILDDLSSSPTVCQGDQVFVIQSSTASEGFDTGFLCSLVVDSSGTRLAGQPVIYSTTAGTLSQAADVTGGTGQRANAAEITAGTTGTSGTTATVTASSGGRSGTAEIKFGGDPDECNITTNPTSVAVGGSSVVNVEVLDSTGGPVPDDVEVFVQQSNPGAGANAAILNQTPETSNGTASSALIAAIPGAIALGAEAGDISCTGTVIATGQVIPPVGGTPGPGGAGGFTGTAPGANSIGLLVTDGEATSASLTAALGTAGCTVQTLAVLAGGEWDIFINGAPAVVNAGFPASLPATTPFFVRCS